MLKQYFPLTFFVAQEHNHSRQNHYFQTRKDEDMKYLLYRQVNFNLLHSACTSQATYTREFPQYNSCEISSLPVMPGEPYNFIQKLNLIMSIYSVRNDKTTPASGQG